MASINRFVAFLFLSLLSVQAVAQERCNCFQSKPRRILPDCWSDTESVWQGLYLISIDTRLMSAEELMNRLSLPGKSPPIDSLAAPYRFHFYYEPFKYGRTRGNAEIELDDFIQLPAVVSVECVPSGI